MNSSSQPGFNRKQRIFKDIVLGTLIWACVLGFLNDYSDIAYAESFSLLFLAALVLAILVVMTMWCKHQVLSRFDRQRGPGHNGVVILGVWLILFLSKFLFIGAIDLIFAGTVTVYGFLNIAIVVITATLIQRAAEFVFTWLGENTMQPAQM